MPRIVCRTCGREIYTTAPIEQLFADERRCPRCGAPLQADRREAQRRVAQRRQSSSPASDDVVPAPAPDTERRVTDRRQQKRRRADAGPAGRTPDGWLE